jgi:hypothetical protein
VLDGLRIEAQKTAIGELFCGQVPRRVSVVDSGAVNGPVSRSLP